MSPSTVSTINQLPNELLSEIFLTYREVTRPLMTFSRHRAPWWEKAFWWVDIMLVCCHWRAVALATVDLWKTIVVSTPEIPSFSDDKSAVISCKRSMALRWLDVVLSRTSNAPLRLAFEDKILAQTALPIISDKSLRIHSLKIKNALTMWDDRGASGPKCDPAGFVVTLAMPALEELQLLSSPGVRTSFLDTPAGRFADISVPRYPALRVLRISNFALPETLMDLLTQLYTIDLRFCTIEGSGKRSPSDLLDILAKCPSLVELRLDGVLRTFTRPWRATSGSRPHQLAKLRRLSILDAPHLCADFLSAVTLTPENIVNIRITGVIEETADLFDIPALFASLLPVDRSALWWLTEAYSVYVNNWWGNSFIECRAGGATIKLCLEDLGEYMPPTNLVGYLDAMCELFADAPVRALDVTGHLDDVQDPLTWTCTFAHFPLVGTLSVGCDQSAVLAVLGIRTSAAFSPQIEETGAAGKTGEMTVLPRLTKLSFECVDWEPRLVDEILDTLRWRGKCGAPRLEELVLEPNVKEADVEAFSQYVGEREGEMSSYVHKFEWRMLE